VESEDRPTTISVASLAARIRQLDAGLLAASRDVNWLDRAIWELIDAGQITDEQASVLLARLAALSLVLDHVDPVNTPEEVYEDGALR